MTDKMLLFAIVIICIGFTLAGSCFIVLMRWRKEIKHERKELKYTIKEYKEMPVNIKRISQDQLN